MSEITGLTIYWPKDADWWGWEYVVDLGEEFGPAGPSVYDYLWCQGKKQNDRGYVKTGYRTIARAVFTDVDTVRHVLSRASRIGAVKDLTEDGVTFTCRVSGLRSVIDRSQAAERKRAQRARETAQTQGAEPNQETGPTVSDRDASRSVTPGPEKSLEVKGKKRTTETSPDPSASGGEPGSRPVCPEKPTGRRKRDLERYEAQLASYHAELDVWAPHVADLNGLGEPWGRIDATLRSAVQESTYYQCLVDLHPHRIVGDTLVLAAPIVLQGRLNGQPLLGLITKATAAVLPGIGFIDVIPCTHSTGEENR